MKKSWEIDKILNIEERKIVKNLATDLKCPTVIAELLFRKNMTNSEQLNNFFNPDLSMLHDPFLFNDMKKAVDRILSAINTGEKITIYGDYDVDGTTASALLYLGLKELNAVIDYYIPNRMIDGYGLSENCLESLKETGTSLIITVDCGIISTEETETIKKMGMEVIITDHHNSKINIPDAVAVINPKIINCNYPDKDLAGVGVAYKLLLAIFQQLGILNSYNISKYLYLVALGTISDIVSLTGENRVFATLGLMQLIKKKNTGINELLNTAGITNKIIDENDIIFSIAPRINAAGRMGSAMRAVELLISSDKMKCKELSEIIERENSLRQRLDKQTYDEAIEIINKKYKNLNDAFCIVISSDSWHPGVIGIVASKLVEKYHRPAIMITHQEGLGSGSGRSIPSFDIFKALENCEDILESFGGHKYAVGLTILPEYITALENRLNNYFKQNTDTETLIPVIKINKKIELYEITFLLMDWIRKFAPFGANNMIPVFYTEQVRVQGFPYNVGKNHLKMKVTKDGFELDLIGFNLGDYLPILKNNSCLDIAYSLDLATWQGQTSVQGYLKDIQLHE